MERRLGRAPRRAEQPLGPAAQEIHGPRAAPTAPPAAPAASVTLGGPGPGAQLPHRHRPSRRRRRQRQLGASARGPGRAEPTRCCATRSRTLTGRGWGRRAASGPRGGRSRGRPAPLAARVSTPHGAGRLRPGSLRPPCVRTQAAGLAVECSVLPASGRPGAWSWGPG